MLNGFFLFQAAARWLPGFGEWYATRIYPALVGSAGRIFGAFPFSVVEALLYPLLIYIVWYGIRHIRQGRQIANRAFFMVSLFLFLYTVNCGINYYRAPFSSFLDYEIKAGTKQDLESLLAELTAQVNTAQGQLTAGTTDVSRESRAAMERLGLVYPSLSGFYPQPKGLLFSRVMSVQQLAGIYSPFTVEANYNREMPFYNIPHTACHELSHLKGFMREDEANFIGFLACIGSEDMEFRYSGYLMAWIYAGNALAADDKELYRTYWNLLNESSRQELLDNSLFWQQYDSKAAEVAERMNDTYLKANSQRDGVKSYGRVVDLLLAWHMK